MAYECPLPESTLIADEASRRRLSMEELGEDVEAARVQRLGTKNSPGDEISNKATLMAEIDEALGQVRPPDVEFILADSVVDCWHSHVTKRLGHALVRYTLPDGTQRIMNISGAKAASMVNFPHPADYFAGTTDWDTAIEQGGVYNRAFWGLRIERAAPGTVIALDMFYEALAAKEQIPAGGHASFMLVGSRFASLWQAFSPFAEYNVAAVGNCAVWTSRGLSFVGLLQRTRMFPKAILTELLEKETAAGDSRNVHLVEYREVEHAVKVSEGRGNAYSLVSPLDFVRNIYYFNLQPFADAVVEVPKGKIVAQVRINAERKRPHGAMIRHALTLQVLLVVVVLWAMDLVGAPGIASWIALHVFLY